MSIFNKILASLIVLTVAFFITPCAYAQMQFVENKGQWNPKVQYRGDFSTGSFFLENKGFTVLLNNPDDLITLGDFIHGHAQESHQPNEHAAGAPGHNKPNRPNFPFTLHASAYKVDFLGASKNVQQAPDKTFDTYNNYFIGNDKNKWASNCKIYQAVTYTNLYPNIDVRYYSDAAGRLKYDFIVKPGGNVSAIAMRYDGVSSLSIKDKELIISTPAARVKELYPYSFQTSLKGGRQEVECRYVLRDNVVSFQVKDYDSKQNLVIDPSIIFSSFTGSTADNWGYTATPGPDGSFFAGGIVFASGYPVSPGAYDQTFNGGVSIGGSPGYDIGIFKFSANGSQKLYATYLGGTGNEQPHSMITDAQGNLVIAGRTNSLDYPLKLPARDLIGPTGKEDIILTKFNAAGTALIGSVKIGGSGDDGVNIRTKDVVGNGAESLRRNYGDDARSEVILDGSNNIFLVSCSRKGSSPDFPVRNSPIQPVYGGGEQDGVVMKFNADLSSLLFSTYFGGKADDACFVASLNPVTGNLYIGGGTASDDLPGNKSGVIKQTFEGGEADGFVSELSPDGSSILKTTYLSANRINNVPSIELVYGLKFDKFGFPYVMGTTTGSWPVTANARQVNPGSKQFISKLQPDLSAYIYSTVFGKQSAQPNISPIAFLVDRCENVYVSGWGGGLNTAEGYSTGNTFGLPEVNPLSGIPAEDGADFYFYVLAKDAASQLFGSHFGQNGGLGDHVDGGTSRFDANGVIYQAICANCAGNNQNPPSRNIAYPTTPGVVARFNGSTGCNELALKIDMNFAGVGSKVQASINAVVNDTTGCIPLKVVFTDILQRGKKYYWDFGDGNKDTTTSNLDSNTYLLTGNYRVMLITEDSLTCNIRDTSYVNIKASDNIAVLGFTALKGSPCTSLSYIFKNTSIGTKSGFGPNSFVWDFGDGSAPDTAGLTPDRIHIYQNPGNYTVRLYLIDTAFCNSPDSLSKIIRLNPSVKAMFNTPDIGCAPYFAVFENTSLGGTDFKWEFGDGTFSIEENPTHLYSLPNTYLVRLIATDTSTCNKIDTSALFSITVLPKPTALFSWAPNPPEPNVPVRFTNLSSGATRYLWDFGDGESSTVTNPVHEYNETKTYTAILYAFNAGNCADTFSLPVDVLINPLLDVPNAFTPAQGGVNSTIFVRGFGVSRMSWKIYNRWGQLVFESSNKSSGWNGTFKGKLQPTDVYTYTLDAELSDGKKIRKTGDITLLR
ncbi:MAG: PKD domain-containing protein [Ferruginibacter sp.]